MHRFMKLDELYGALKVTSVDDIYEKYSNKRTRQYVLKCACGKEFDLSHPEWNKSIRDCGCGAGEVNPKTVTTVSMTIEMRRKIKRYCAINRRNMSQAIDDLCEYALSRMELESEAEAGKGKREETEEDGQ